MPKVELYTQPYSPKPNPSLVSLKHLSIIWIIGVRYDTRFEEYEGFEFDARCHLVHKQAFKKIRQHPEFL